MVGDGEAETGPLATAWHSNKFLNPVRDGAVLPILHLNGYKIANPTLLARIPRAELLALFTGYGWAPRVVEGSEPEAMHQAMAEHHYYLQALIYAIAVARFLHARHALPDSIAIRYLFLRGLNENNHHGIWHWDIATADLADWLPPKE